MHPNDVRYPWEEPESETSPTPAPADADVADDGGNPAPNEEAAAHASPLDVTARESPLDTAAHAPDEPSDLAGTDWTEASGAYAETRREQTEDADVDHPESVGPAAVAARDRPIAPKEYYSISEVCDLVDLKPHVLRYWETQFGVLNPSKNRSGNRVYQRKEIKLILLVKHLLYEEKYTVEGAKQKLEQLRRSGDLGPTTARALDTGILQMLETELHALSAILTVPEGTDANPGHQR
jgi:DNA-binding transcriptional MerR regulator